MLYCNGGIVRFQNEHIPLVATGLVPARRIAYFKKFKQCIEIYANACSIRKIIYVDFNLDKRLKRACKLSVIAGGLFVKMGNRKDDEELRESDDWGELRESSD
jgi:hypothetical protein